MEYDYSESYGQTLFTNITGNAVDSLEMVEILLQMERPSKWKWAPLAMYHSLYAFLLDALGGTAPKLYLAEVPKQREALVLYIHDGWSIKEIAKELKVSKEDVCNWIASPKVINMRTALDRMAADNSTIGESQGASKDSGKNAQPRRPASVKRLSLSESQRKSIDWLITELRNPFEHFMPKHWYIVLSGLPTILLDVLATIEFVALESNGPLLDNEEKEHVAKLCGRIRLLLETEHKELNPMNTLPAEAESGSNELLPG